MNKRIKKIIISMIFIAIIMTNCIFVYATNDLNVDAKASLIIEENSGKVIHEDNSNVQNYPASVTKILTAILTLENCELTDTVTVSKTAISNIPSGYVIAPLFVGEQMSVEDLLYALMLKSANDAAYVLAEHVGGSVEGFSEMMNKKAEELGCKNTHFVNPNGIHNSNHYTTAYDMYLIARYAMKNEEFVKIVSTYQHALSATNKYSKNDRIMKNTNSFVNPSSRYYDENVKGIKTGTTLQAGNCLITNISKNGFDVITVILGARTSESKFSETKKMMNYTFDNYEFTQIHKKGDVIKNIEVEKATKETKSLNLIISDDIKAEEIEPEISLVDEIIAPILKGQELGTIKYTVDGLEYNAKLLAENDVIKKTYYVEILLGVGVFIIIVGVIIIIKKRPKKKEKLSEW